VRSPAFPQHEVERLREEQRAEIMQRSTEPRALADDMAVRFIYAPGSTYQRPAHGDEAHVAALTADDVKQFHNARYQPDTTSVMLVGDIDFARGHQLVRDAFGDWSGHASPENKPSNAPGEPRTVHVVDRPGSVQSELRIGHVGVERNHPDHFALLVANSILGGAFTSRLNMNLREKQGFTYGVRSAFGYRRSAGPFVISTAVGTDVTARALEEAFKELRLLLADGVTDEETANARNYIAGVLPLQLQSTEELASKLAEIIVYDLPDDYFQDYRRHILAIDRGAAEAAARKHIRLEDMVTIVTGDASKIRDDIDKLGIGTIDVVSEEEEEEGNS
jgi:predicted Zn-dependent peptidase